MNQCSKKQIHYTKEQESIIKKVNEEKKNILIIAKAGCAKTSTLFFVAEKLQKKILLITYNKKLRKDSIKQARDLNLEDKVECHTFHSLALKYYLNKEERNDFGDSLIHDALNRKGKKENMNFNSVNAVFIDECQDLTLDLANFLNKVFQDIYQDTQEKPLVIICGDPFQRIYPFRKTSLTYLMNPEKYFGSFIQNEGKFEMHTLSYCFRITPPMASWINQYMHPKFLQDFYPEAKWKELHDQFLTWWGEGIHSAKPRGVYAPVTYMKVKNWNDFTRVALELQPYYDQYDPELISLLAFSGKSKNAPVYKLINALTELDKTKKINWAYFFNEIDQDQITDEEKFQESTKGKRIASTIHKYRGIDNKVIIVFGLDGFLEKMSQDIFDLFCLNYVAVTRACEKLIVIQCYKEPFLTIRKAIEFDDILDNYATNNTSIITTLTPNNNKKKRKRESKKKQKKVLSFVDQICQRILRYKKNGLRISDMYAFVPYDPFLDQQDIDISISCYLPEIEEEEEEKKQTEINYEIIRKKKKN